MRVETATALIPADIMLKPAIGARKQGLSHLPDSHRSKSQLKFLGFGVRSNGRIYGPSGRNLRARKSNGGLVDIYV